MIQTVSFYCLIALFGAVFLNMIRIAIGPTIADRALAADGIFLNLVGIAAVYSVYASETHYIDLALVFSLLGFVGMVCFAKFLARGKMVE